MNEINNNKVNLCDSCSQVYPDCTSQPENVYFGDGVGHDNICACSEYRPSEQPQLEDCPIYGGMCGYPSNLCYECPRHEGAKERPQWWTEGLQPFAQPKRIKGRWLRKESDISWWYECSECGESPLFDPYENEVRTPFCPWCGSDMRGDEDVGTNCTD